MLLQSLPLLNIATWVATASVKGTVLIGAVILFRPLLTPSTASPWRHAVWLPAFACLICPFGLRLPLTASFGESPSTTDAVLSAASNPARSTLGPTLKPSDRAAARIGTQLRPAHSTVLMSPLPPRASALRSLLPWLALTWAAGAAGLASLYLRNLLRFHRVRRGARPADGKAEAIFEECRKELRVRGNVRLLEGAGVESPAIFGWWRPTLLLPLGLHERLDAMQLRYVLLHELAHVRRNDVLVNWIAAIAQLLHWFNPAIWVAARLMRSDMEFACDASVLRRLSEGERGRYGDMLVQLADSHGAVAAPYALGVVHGHADLKGRLIMIARFGPASIPLKVAAVVALAAFTLVALVQPAFTSPSGGKSGAAQGLSFAGANAAAASPSSEDPRKMGVPLRWRVSERPPSTEGGPDGNSGKLRLGT